MSAEWDTMTNPLGLVLFAVLSVVAVVASIHALRTRLAYGFYRFAAFEALALLIVWSADRWFRDPFSTRQIVSWVLLASSTALAAHGVHLMRTMGGARKRVMEDTQTVVRVGAYRYIRHPMYASLALLGWGVFSKGTDVIGGVLAATVTTFLVVTARSEESFNIARLGATYSEYMKHTKMFIPFVI